MAAGPAYFLCCHLYAVCAMAFNSLHLLLSDLLGDAVMLLIYVAVKDEYSCLSIVE